ncbi:myosin-13-like [Carcharodon carcharias]|uniref:myosin-13-like n=1 Tax=Carcharodon carcharias TaxID=13397 RepID=UPI001B7E509D|nr:myosin-13-like [Carcharodon carcharias]
MGGKNPLLFVVVLLILLIALGIYQWTVMTENALLKQEATLVRESTGKLKREKEDTQSLLAEMSITLDDKKRYISDIDGKFLKVNADLENKNKALQQCIEEKKKMGEDATKQKNELKTKEDQLKKMEEEKKKVEADLEEFKKLCEVADNSKELTKKLCPQAPLVQQQ